MSRARENTNALRMVRTLRARAMEAHRNLTANGGSETRHVPPRIDEDGYVAGRTERYEDPDAVEMQAILQDFLEKTQKWDRKVR